MQPQLLQQMVAGARLVQALTGEPITIGVVGYTCTPSTMVTSTPEFVAGGMIDKQAITVTVLQADLTTAPAIDTLVSFRGAAFRVFETEDAVVSWQIHLIQEQA